jgi:predicted nucleotidyltransferase
MPLQINENEQKAIEKLFKQIKDALNVKKLILFGSRTRGEAEEYSDIDILVLTENPRNFADRDKLSDASAEINVDFGVTISCLYYNEMEWETGDTINPLLRDNINREGVELVIQ